MCAVEYLYRTRDCKFANKALKFSSRELRGVARAIIDNKMPIAKWMNAKHTTCDDRI